MRVAVAQLEPLESVDRLTARLGGDLLHGRLEALPDVEHEVCVEDLLDFAWGQLEVVRLRAGGREVRHVDAVAADLLGREREG